MKNLLTSQPEVRTLYQDNDIPDTYLKTQDENVQYDVMALNLPHDRLMLLNTAVYASFPAKTSVQ